MNEYRDATITHADVIKDVVSAARKVHEVRISLAPFTDPNSLEFQNWQDSIRDKEVRLSVAVERLDAFERERKV